MKFPEDFKKLDRLSPHFGQAKDCWGFWLNFYVNFFGQKARRQSSYANGSSKFDFCGDQKMNALSVIFGGFSYATQKDSLLLFADGLQERLDKINQRSSISPESLKRRDVLSASPREAPAFRGALKYELFEAYQKSVDGVGLRVVGANWRDLQTADTQEALRGEKLAGALKEKLAKLDLNLFSVKFDALKILGTALPHLSSRQIEALQG